MEVQKKTRGPNVVVPWLLLVALFGVCALLLAVVVTGTFRPTDETSVQDDVATDDMVDYTPDDAGTWPIYLTSMTHLESNWVDAATDEDYFNLQANLLRNGMDVAEEYRAVLTLESEIPMAEGMVRFDDNILQEALDRGHGAGTHCDIDPDTRFTVTAIVDEFARRKALVDGLIGGDENLGCSGGGGYGDWYAGAVGAGFSYINGIVGFHYLALPPFARPVGWDNKAIIKEYYHDAAPQNWEKFFYPFLVSEVGFTEDANGSLLVSAGTVEVASNISEAGEWAIDVAADCPRNGCTFDENDATAAAAFVTDFVAAHDGSRPAKLTFYLPAHLFSDDNNDALRAFFGALQPLADTGKVQWATQREAYDAVMDYYASVK